ncbi:MAG: hypothetical protein IKL17_01040, partial [Alistipes sp.]|nr:hypothetical protein [Alistipes sp.]
MSKIVIPPVTEQILLKILDLFDYVVAIISKKHDNIWHLDSLVHHSELGRQYMDDSIIRNNATNAKNGNNISISEYLEQGKFTYSSFKVCKYDNNAYRMFVAVYNGSWGIVDQFDIQAQYNPSNKEVKIAPNPKINTPSAILDKVETFVKICAALPDTKELFVYCICNIDIKLGSNYSLLFTSVQEVDEYSLQLLYSLLPSCVIDDATNEIQTES